MEVYESRDTYSKNAKDNQDKPSRSAGRSNRFTRASNRSSSSSLRSSVSVDTSTYQLQPIEKQSTRSLSPTNLPRTASFEYIISSDSGSDACISADEEEEFLKIYSSDRR